MSGAFRDETAANERVAALESENAALREELERRAPNRALRDRRAALLRERELLVSLQGDADRNAYAKKLQREHADLRLEIARLETRREELAGEIAALERARKKAGAPEPGIPDPAKPKTLAGFAAIGLATGWFLGRMIRGSR